MKRHRRYRKRRNMINLNRPPKPTWLNRPLLTGGSQFAFRNGFYPYYNRGRQVMFSTKIIIYFMVVPVVLGKAISWMASKF
jgi:hypothetical protein